MKIYFNLVDSYLDGWSSTLGNCQHSVIVEDDHEVLNNPYIFKFIDGELLKDEEKQKAIIEENERERNQPTLEELNALAILELTERLERERGES